MSYFAQNPFAASSSRYKGCLIVLEPPREDAKGFVCQGRLILGGRMNLPLAPAYGSTEAEATEAAQTAAHKTIDRLEQSMAKT